MTFLASYTQRALVVMQKNQKQFELNVLRDRAVRISRALSDMDAENGLMGEDAPDLSENPYYVSLERESELLEAEVTQVEQAVELFTKQEESLASVVKTNVTPSCKLNFSGGS